MNAIGRPGGTGAQAVAALFPAAEERERWEDFLTSALGDAMRRTAAGAVGSDLDAEAFAGALGGFDFAEPRPLAEVLPWVIGQLEHGIVHLTHPGYFGLFNPSPSFPAECAERIAAAFNPQLATARTSPVPVAIEAHVVRAVAQRAGLPAQSSGHFTTGGSEANFTALVCALTQAHPAFGTQGARAFAGPPVFYVSEDAHHAWHKIAHQAGVGRSALRQVATDPLGQMDAAMLAAMMAEDRAAGCVAVMVVATAGTTGAGMIDPMPACAGIARDHGAWFHVDAAWGGALIASERLRPALAGIETADSITIDAHKWFATTMGCGMFLTTRPEILPAAFHAEGSYMPSNDPARDPYVSTVQWSRRFLGLRLFLSLAAAGWQGHAAHVENAIALIAFLRDELAGQGWTIANTSPLGVLCLDPPPGFPGAAEIARSIVASNEAWVASTLFGSRTVLRICVTNGRTTRRDVLALVHLLRACGPATA